MSYTLVDPVHPGEIIREEILPNFGLSIKDAAIALGTARPGLNNIVNEKMGVSAELALKIEKAFGYSAQRLVTMQATFDLADAKQNKADTLAAIKPVKKLVAA